MYCNSSVILYGTQAYIWYSRIPIRDDTIGTPPPPLVNRKHAQIYIYHRGIYTITNSIWAFLRERLQKQSQKGPKLK